MNISLSTYWLRNQLLTSLLRRKAAKKEEPARISLDLSGMRLPLEREIEIRALYFKRSDLERTFALIMCKMIPASF
jgi:hypothetical protein